MSLLSDVTSEELKDRVESLVAKMGDLAAKFGPLLVEYGQMRREAEVIVKELENRGIIKKDG